jgi:hypothetical protein
MPSTFGLSILHGHGTPNRLDRFPHHYVLPQASQSLRQHSTAALNSAESKQGKPIKTIWHLLKRSGVLQQSLVVVNGRPQLHDEVVGDFGQLECESDEDAAT